MEYSKKVRARVRILLLTSSLAVALVFGLSFYFSLVSAESALASKVPELAELAERFKSTLTINTLAFAAIIIGSFFALGSLITDRLFKPLESIERGLLSFSSGAIPSAPPDSTGGSFDSLVESYASARSHIEKRVQSDISILEECLKKIVEGVDVAEMLQGLIDEKKSFYGIKEAPEAKSGTAPSDESVFMQPV
jgi:hypothetical protein